MGRSRTLSIAIIAVTAMVSLALWPRLPAEMAIHFSASGTPDNVVPRALGVVLVPAIMALTLLLLRAAMRYDPPPDPRVGRVVTVATMGFLGTLQAIVLGWNLGYTVPFDFIFVGSLVWAAALCGYVIRREGVSPG